MPKSRRYCRVEGCSKIVKSQGLCQRHGAKTRLCKVENCPKQAQGNFDGMCKSHFKQSRVDLKETLVVPNTVPPPPSGQSVYDHILPASISYQPDENSDSVMPLVAHLKKGFDENRPRGWHRNEERRARGLWPVSKAAVQLQGWERELVWMEICILSGSSQASFRHLARAWGRDKGFHMVLTQFICQRRGNVERKKRPKGALKRGEEEYPEEEFMNDILSFEDMDMPIPIEILNAFQHEHSDDSEDSAESEEGHEMQREEAQLKHEQEQAHEQSHSVDYEAVHSAQSHEVQREVAENEAAHTAHSHQMQQEMAHPAQRDQMQHEMIHHETAYTMQSHQMQQAGLPHESAHAAHSHQMQQEMGHPAQTNQMQREMMHHETAYAIQSHQMQEAGLPHIRDRLPHEAVHSGAHSHQMQQEVAHPAQHEMMHHETAYTVQSHQTQQAGMPHESSYAAHSHQMQQEMAHPEETNQMQREMMHHETAYTIQSHHMQEAGLPYIRDRLPHEAVHSGAHSHQMQQEVAHPAQHEMMHHETAYTVQSHQTQQAGMPHEAVHSDAHPHQQMQNEGYVDPLDEHLLMPPQNDVPEDDPLQQTLEQVSTTAQS